MGTFFFLLLNSWVLSETIKLYNLFEVFNFGCPSQFTYTDGLSYIKFPESGKGFGIAGIILAKCSICQFNWKFHFYFINLRRLFHQLLIFLDLYQFLHKLIIACSCPSQFHKFSFVTDTNLLILYFMDSV